MRLEPSSYRHYRAALVGLVLLSGCSLLESPGDQHFAARDFEAARAAYIEVLEQHETGRKVEQALYHLGLIYLNPDPVFYDPLAAEAVLTRLSYIRPRSSFAAKASLLLELQLETTHLRETIANQLAARVSAEQDLVSLRETASESEAESEDHAKKVGELGSQLGRLKSQIATLRGELAARETELEQLKQIDLEDPL